MPAYIIALSKVTNMTEELKEYVKLSAEMCNARGAKYIVKSPPKEMLEGEQLKEPIMIVQEWPSLKEAHDFYYSDEYQNKVKPLRDNTGIYDLAIYEGSD